MDEKQEEKKKIGLVFVPLFGLSHLVPMVELAKKVLVRHGHQFFIEILFIPPLEPSPQIHSYMSSVSSSGLDISFHHLPTTDPSIFRNSRGRAAIPSVVKFQKPHVKAAIQDLVINSSGPIAAVFVDMFCIDHIDAAKELGIPCYLFFTSGITALGFMIQIPAIDASLPAGKNMDELEEDGSDDIHVLGFSSSLPPMALPQALIHRKQQEQMWIVDYTKRFPEVAGFVVNSFAELQPLSINMINQGLCLPGRPTPPTYPIGPMLSLESNPSADDKQQHECIRWLDKQPSKSVVFLCFGSMGSFSTNQARETAEGLERSGQRFLWVLRSPPNSETSRNPTDAFLDEVLPQGFLERTMGRGMVWPSFAPQVEILSHSAVGGFVTHCGWNSCLESLWFGVPMLAWPLFAEQHLNAIEMVKEMGVAIGLKIDRKAGNWVTGEEVERGVRSLMEQEFCEQSRIVRNKTKEMMEKGRRAIEEGGSSFHYMEMLVRTLISNVP